MSTQEMYARLPFESLSVRAATLITRVSKWLAVKKEARVSPRRLYVAERVSLGEKSSLFVVHVDGRRFLLANGQANATLVTELSPEESFGSAVQAAASASQVPVKRPRAPRAEKRKESA